MKVEYADTGVRPRHLSDYLLSHGRPVVDLRSAGELMGLDLHAAPDALVRLRKAGLMFSPARGLHVAVPPEYRLWRAVPAMDFIEPMMAAHSRQYYVALLSAAELHGAAHQRPQVFQVMADKILADRDFGRVRLRFYSRENLPEVPVIPVNSSSGTVPVSSPAAAPNIAFKSNPSNRPTHPREHPATAPESAHIMAEDQLRRPHETASSPKRARVSPSR